MDDKDVIGAIQWIIHITGGMRNHSPPHDVTVIARSMKGMEAATRTSGNTLGSDDMRVVLDVEEAETQMILRTPALRTAVRTVVGEDNGMTVTRRLTVGHWHMVTNAMDANESITDAGRTGAGQKSLIWAGMVPLAGCPGSSRHGATTNMGTPTHTRH